MHKFNNRLCFRMDFPCQLVILMKQSSCPLLPFPSSICPSCGVRHMQWTVGDHFSGTRSVLTPLPRHVALLNYSSRVITYHYTLSLSQVPQPPQYPIITIHSVHLIQRRKLDSAILFHHNPHVSIHRIADCVYRRTI